MDGVPCPCFKILSVIPGIFIDALRCGGTLIAGAGEFSARGCGTDSFRVARFLVPLWQDDTLATANPVAMDCTPRSDDQGNREIEDFGGGAVAIGIMIN